MSALSVNLERKVSIILHFQIYPIPCKPNVSVSCYSFEELDRIGQLIRGKHEESQASRMDRERKKGWAATRFIERTEFRFERGCEES